MYKSSNNLMPDTQYASFITLVYALFTLAISRQIFIIENKKRKERTVFVSTYSQNAVFFSWEILF